MSKEVAILFDASKCTACKGCQINCKQWNQLPSELSTDGYEFTGSFENPLENDGDTWLHMKFNEIDTPDGQMGWAFGRDACQHCTNAACAEVCPTGACHTIENGSVVIDKEKCVGCKYCVSACPFDVPKYRERDNVSQKCWMCQDRLEAGKQPACVSTCPAGALQFGEREEMITLAQARLDKIKPSKPAAEVYGIKEMGGLHVISVLPYGAEAHGMPRNPKPHVLTDLSSLIKPVMGVGVLGMLGVVTASLIGGRGSEHGVDQYTYDPETGVTYDNGVAMDEGKGDH